MLWLPGLIVLAEQPVTLWVKVYFWKARGAKFFLMLLSSSCSVTG